MERPVDVYNYLLQPVPVVYPNRTIPKFEKPFSFMNIHEFPNTYLNQLAKYMLPRHIFPLKCMPLNTNGKLDRNALVARIDVDMNGDLHEIDSVLKSHGLVA